MDENVYNESLLNQGGNNTNGARARRRDSVALRASRQLKAFIKQRSQKS